MTAEHVGEFGGGRRGERRAEGESFPGGVLGQARSDRTGAGRNLY